MKKKLLFLFLCFFIFLLPGKSSAQVFRNSNSWINYSQPYYKFKILADQQIYKIPYSSLSAAGLGSIPGSQFQLFKNGKEVALFVTTAGSFGANDYIEFYGTKNDGWTDSALYMQGGQANTKLSMFTDSAAYYLTYNNQTHLRYTLVTNSLTNHPPPQPYCLYTVHLVNGARAYGWYYQGVSATCVNGDCLYLPEWDNGEGYLTAAPVAEETGYGGSTVSFSFNAPYIYTSNTSLFATVTGSFWGYSLLGHQVQLGINTTPIYSVPTFYGVTRFDFNYAISNSYFNQINSNTTLFYSNVNSTVSFDEDAMAHMELQYPRLFNFGNNSVLNFTVPGSSVSNQFLAISNYNNNNTTPLIFDLTNLVVMQGIVGTNDSVYFNLPASASNRNLIITSQATSDIETIPVLQKRVFVDYTNPGNEGDFIIISNPVLYNDGKGNNYVQQYADFKNSCGYHSVVVDINQLYDQFAYGVQRHPLSIRNFALYARQHWTIKPKYILLIGKGSEWESGEIDANLNYADFNDDPADYIPLCLVPTFGTPGADELFTATTYNPTPAIPVGRISTTNPADIAAYLQKAKDFVSNQTTTPALQTIANKLWQKDILHFAGGSDASQEMEFQSFLLNYQNIIQGTFYGGNVATFLKSSPNPVQQATSQTIYSAINNGVSLMTFFGHSSPDGFDFSVDNPADLNNYKKYPLLISNGCYLGDIFQLTPGESEQYVNIPNKGAIAFLGSSYLADDGNLFNFSNGFYKNICQKSYNNAIGDAIVHTVKYLVDTAYAGDIIGAKLTAEQMILCGDPSLGLNNHAKPDYDLEPSTVHFMPSVITAADASFDLIVYPTNLGMAIDTSIYISVTRTFPNGTVLPLYQQKIQAPYYQDSVKFKVYTDSTLGYGLNKFTVTIDSKNQIDEITKINNSVTVDLFINGEDIIPAYPYNYSIVNAQNITNNKGLVLKASTVNPFAAPHKYFIQIDTTALFNSPLMQSYSPVQGGGVVKWKPNIILHDSTVYYWRTAYDTLYNGNYNWHTYSFIYLPKSSPGWNQSHLYQYLNDNFANIYDSTDREFHFVKNIKTITAVTGVTALYGSPPGPIVDPFEISYYINSFQYLVDDVVYGPIAQTTFMLAVFDASTGLPLQNPPDGSGYGKYGSFNEQAYPLNGFFFNTVGLANQDTIVNFINNDIPKGDYVLGFTVEQAFLQQFGPALLSALKTLGCTRIDTTTFDRPYMFFGKKGGGKAFPTTEIFANAPLQTITGNFTIKGNWDAGYVQSPTIGPAEQWSSFHWKHHALQKPSTDSASVTILGVNNAGGQTVLYKAFTGTDLALNFINPKIYSNVIVQENTTDTTNKTPAQLNFWRVNYQPVPDAALNPNAYFTLSKDTPFQLGEPFSINVDVDNITDYNMDSLWMKYTVISPSGNTPPYFNKRHPLGANDSLHVNFSYTVPNANNTGINNLLIEVNPYEHHQLEEYHYNNLGDLPFNVQKDLTNPILDVTFNGVHILNNDIVSAKPEILIRLKDENKYLALRDTGLIQVFLEYPGTTTPVRVYYKNGTNMLFTSAPISGLNSTDNICTVSYNPAFTVDGTYTLMVEAHDSAGNVSGANAYQVAFEVINKEMISSVLNYPNPFTSSTRFVFTITGSQVPSFFKIEIMTITGKIVKEITQNDIGPLHIGTNISQYAWNGTDQYGNPVGNGLYLYHVVASLDGQAIAHYDSGADQYIKSGFGKMYLMR
jgi:hypothetical protein